MRALHASHGTGRVSGGFLCWHSDLCFQRSGPELPLRYDQHRAYRWPRAGSLSLGRRRQHLIGLHLGLWILTSTSATHGGGGRGPGRPSYQKATFGTHTPSLQMSKGLNELYSTTVTQVERYIGQPFEVPGLGSITYPFVVLRHAGGQRNVILVAPAP
jgi:hypothetical protein